MSQVLRMSSFQAVLIFFASLVPVAKLVVKRSNAQLAQTSCILGIDGAIQVRLKNFYRRLKYLCWNALLWLVPIFRTIHRCPLHLDDS